MREIYVSGHEKTSCIIRERSRILLLMNTREERALDLAARFRIVGDGSKWTVPSQTRPTEKYSVRIVGNYADCECPDFELRRDFCKHILAVQLVIKREHNADGSMTVTETITVAERKTYPQQWTAYNQAQTHEQDHFQTLLHERCKGIETEPQTGRGQRRLPLSDAIFSVAFKVYSTVSGRRFMSDLRQSHERGFISKVPHYNSIFNYLENPELTPLLTSLILQSSLPLKSVETDFAVDSSGFSTSRFERWFSHKWGRETFQRQWVKVHLMCGVKTNVVTAVEIREKHTADSNMLPPLVETTAQNFDVAEVSADKAYLSAKNIRTIRNVGAMPFIAFKSNSTDRGATGKESKVWREMFHYFMWKKDDFLARYHKRSNVETTFSMMKRKFGDSLRSKTDTAMVNEVLCKVLCHNLVVLIHEMYELGIDPISWAGSTAAQQESVN